MMKALLVLILTGFISCSDNCTITCEIYPLNPEDKGIDESSIQQDLLVQLDSSLSKIEDLIPEGYFGYQITKTDGGLYEEHPNPKQRTTSFKLDQYGEVIEKSYREREINLFTREYGETTLEFIENESELGINEEGEEIKSIQDLYLECENIIKNNAEDENIILSVEYDSNGYLKTCSHLDKRVADDVPTFGITGLSIYQINY